MSRTTSLAFLLFVAACDDNPIAPTPPPTEATAPQPANAKMIQTVVFATAFNHAHLVRPIHSTDKSEPAPRCRLQPYRPDGRMHENLVAIQMPELGDDAALRETWRAIGYHARNDRDQLISDFGVGPDYYDLGEGTGTLTLRTGLVCIGQNINGEKTELSADDCRSDSWEKLGLPRPQLKYTNETVIRSTRVVTNEDRIVRDTIPSDVVVALGDGNLHVIPGTMYVTPADQAAWCAGPLRVSAP